MSFVMFVFVMSLFVVPLFVMPLLVMFCLFCLYCYVFSVLPCDGLYCNNESN